MRRTLFLLSLCGALLLSACAAPPPPDAAMAMSDPDRTQILAVMQASTDGWNRGDLRGHLALYDASVTAMTKNGPRPGVAAIETAFSAAYFRDGKPKQALRTERVVIRPLERNAALMTGRFVLSGGDEPELSGWFTLIWVRTPQGWRVVHDHTS